LNAFEKSIWAREVFIGEKSPIVETSGLYASGRRILFWKVDSILDKVDVRGEAEETLPSPL
jgi:hypothetical protein